MKKLSLLILIFAFACKSIDSSRIIDEKKFNESSNKFDVETLKPSKDYKKKTKVAVFVPLSGKNKELGTQLANSAILSLFDNDSGNNIELVLIDSKEDSQETAKAFKEVVNRKIKIVIGPIFSQSIEAIEKDVKQHEITVISFSNNHQLLGKIYGQGGIFLSGVILEQQLDKIVGYAVSKGKNSFSIISPNNPYGMTIANFLKKIAKGKEGVFVSSEFYEPNEKSIEQSVQRIVGSFTVPSKLAEGGGNKLKKDFVPNEYDKIYPQIILINDSGKNLSKIASLIRKFDKEERNFQLIGTNQWDDGFSITDKNLNGSWFVSSEREKFSNFEKSYYQAYGKFPPRISSIAYDMVSVIAGIIEKNQGKHLVASDFISYTDVQKNGFDGIDGLFRFLPNGLVQRNLAVLEIDYGQLKTIDKPVEKFLKY
jgi:ABC-type branched-subunit amino acid transport system substrate-binding protein